MADTTWGVKVSEDLKEKIAKALQDSDMSGKEFIEALLQTYEIQKIKESQPHIKADFDELQMLTSRMNGIYANMAERIESLSKAKDLEFQLQTDTKNNVLKIYNTKNKELEEQINQLVEEKDRLTKLNEESLKRITEIEETTATNRTLVAEYKEKNDLLTGMLAEYKPYKEKIENLKGELEQERQAKRTAEEKLQDCLKEAASLKTTLEDAKIRCVSDLERVQEKADIEKMKELLQVKADYQEKHEQVVATAQAAIGKLQEESSAKIKSLLDRIDHLQTPAKQKSHPVK